MSNGYKTEVAPEYEDKYLQMNPGAVKGKDYGYKGDKKKGENLKQKQEGKKVYDPGAKGGKLSHSLEKKAGPKKGSYAAAYQGLEDVGGGQRKDKYGRVWESEAKFTKAAQDWNKKKYGTTEPTATARKKDISKETLATEHKAASTKVASIAPKSITETKANERMQQSIASATAPADLMTGTKTRRQARREGRQLARTERRAERGDNRSDRRTERKMGRKMGEVAAQIDRKNKESANQERKNLLTDNPVDDRSAHKGYY